MEAGDVKNTKHALEVKNLVVDFVSESRSVTALRNISFHIDEGESVGMVGESGCGKSLTALSVMRLIPSPPGRITSGSVMFDGSDLLKKSEKEMRAIRGNRISMIFQEPMTSLNPVFTIGDQIAEVVRLHLRKDRKESMALAEEMLARVGIADARRRLNEYPHELSGGLRQRVMIAMALLCKPGILVADEPTTALDVTIQAQIMDLLNSLKAELGTSVLMITHDLGVIAESSSRVLVMYAGSIVEEAPVVELFAHPAHPYTVGLLASLPRMGQCSRLSTIPGVVPDLSELGQGCAFRPRCPYAKGRCATERPELRSIADGHRAACWEVVK